MKILIVGCFDPIHEGHIDHIKKAYKLGDWLIIVTHKDEAIIEKKGYYMQGLEVRQLLLEGILAVLGGKGEVMTAFEDDMPDRTYNDGISETLRHLKPDKFVKGGDRTPDNMPKSEVETCKDIGCEIVYGVGALLNSSGRMAKRC